MPPRRPASSQRSTKNQRLPFRFRLGKAMFVLPNLFTVSSIFCGFYAILKATTGGSPADFYKASLAVTFGLFFDMADGRVARLTRTQSEFGVQLDSLADLVTFGVAPAVVVHQWGLQPLGIVGTLAAFAYIACGALRLARFNVLANQPNAASLSTFIGLPIPLAAGTLISLVMFHQRTFARPPTQTVAIAALILLLGLLMVSNVPYRAFKDVRVSRKTLLMFLSVAVTFGAISALTRPTFALLTFFSAYVGVGALESVWHRLRKGLKAR